jgi:hypothetical protein
MAVSSKSPSSSTRPVVSFDNVSPGRSVGESISESLGDGMTQHQPTQWTKRAGMITCLVMASVVAVMVISGLIRSNNRLDRFTEAQRSLDAALVKIPFSTRLPKPIPSGARLVGVITQEPDKKRGPSIYALETTYILVGDTAGQGSSARYFKVWQTNDVYIRKTALDPLGSRLNPTKIGVNTWYRVDGESVERQKGVSYSTRFEDGITMVVSGPDEKLVLATINALTK